MKNGTAHEQKHEEKGRERRLLSQGERIREPARKTER